LVGLAIAYLALNLGLLPADLYSALVVTALATTLVFQIVIFTYLRQDPAVMD
jgi:hypothetical protein